MGALRRGGGGPGGKGYKLGARLGGQFAHADEELRDLGQALLVLVHQELGPVLQVVIYLGQGVRVLPLEPADAGHCEVLEPPLRQCATSKPPQAALRLSVHALTVLCAPLPAGFSGSAEAIKP